MNWDIVRSSFGKGSLFVRSGRAEILTISQDYAEVRLNTVRSSFVFTSQFGRGYFADKYSYVEWQFEVKSSWLVVIK